MTPPTLHATPRLRDVLAAQLRAMAIALRAPALVATAAAALATLMVAAAFVRSRDAVDFAPELSMVPGMVGLLLPFGVWKGGERTGQGLLWTLPVDRRRHALARVLAGWVWLMGAAALFVLWLLALALLTGGHVYAEQTVQLLPTATIPAPGALDPAALRAVRWTPHPLLWLVPFTSATGTYLLASAVTLGVRHPLRWLAAAALPVFLLSELALTAGARSLALLPSRALSTVLYGRYGLDVLLTARSESLHTATRLTDGRTVDVWRALPDVGQWATATLLWTGAGLLLLWAAASRHRESRRA